MLEDLLDKWPTEVIAPGDVIGRLTRAAAEHLGLKAAMRLSCRAVPMPSSGWSGSGVTEPGEIAWSRLLTSSSGRRCKPSSQARCAARTWMPAILEGDHRGGRTSTGSVIAWFKRHFAPDTGLTSSTKPQRLGPGAEGLDRVGSFPGLPHAAILTRPHAGNHGIDMQALADPMFSAPSWKAWCLGTRLVIDSFRETLLREAHRGCGWSKQLSILASDSRRHDRRPARTDRSSRCPPSAARYWQQSGRAICND